MTIDRVETSVPDSQENRNVGVLDCSDTSTRTYTISPINIDFNSAYSFSVWVKSSVKWGSNDILVTILGEEGISSIPIKTEWIRFTKVVSSPRSNTIVFMIPSDFTGKIYLYEGMLTKGDAIVDWVMANEDLSNNSDTIINGNNITTGSIKSNLYAYTSGDFSNSGMMIDLDNNIIRSPYFKVDESGASFTGHLVSDSGKIGGFSIDRNGLSLDFNPDLINKNSQIFRINSLKTQGEEKYSHLIYMNEVLSTNPAFATLDSGRVALWERYPYKEGVNNVSRSICAMLDVDRNEFSGLYVYNAELTSTPDSGVVPLVDSDGRAQISRVTPTDIYEHDEKLEDKYSRRYRIGETHTINNIYTCGTITAGKGEVIINYVIPNGLANDISSLSSISIKGRIRHNNVYIIGSGASGGEASFIIKNFSIRDRYNILITVDTSSVSSSITTNNDICSVQLVSGSLKFS